jgi:hypothetical protein
MNMANYISNEVTAIQDEFTRLAVASEQGYEAIRDLGKKILSIKGSDELISSMSIANDSSHKIRQLTRHNDELYHEYVLGKSLSDKQKEVLLAQLAFNLDDMRAYVAIELTATKGFAKWQEAASALDSILTDIQFEKMSSETRQKITLIKCKHRDCSVKL